MNNVISELNELMRRFAEEFEGAVVGQGPKHPDSPRPELQSEIDQFLNEYPFLREDAGYVAFLETYAGATVDSPEGVIVVIFGFLLDVGLHITEDEGPLIDDEGFLTFATVQVRTAEGKEGFHEYTDMAFGFDATGERPPGIYRKIDFNPTAWYCQDFLTWLRLLVENRGRLFDDPPGVTTMAEEQE
jgi:hypothetical protein